MNKNKKKGFTIVELVIVIAVIAILSGVLIPTFSSVTKKAKESAALSDASTALTTVLAYENGALDAENYEYIFVVDGKYYFEMQKGSLTNVGDKSADVAGVPDKYVKGDADTARDANGEIVTTEKTLEDLGADVVVYRVPITDENEGA